MNPAKSNRCSPRKAVIVWNMYQYRFFRIEHHPSGQLKLISKCSPDASPSTQRRLRRPMSLPCPAPPVRLFPFPEISLVTLRMPFSLWPIEPRARTNVPCSRATKDQRGGGMGRRQPNGRVTLFMGGIMPNGEGQESFESVVVCASWPKCHVPVGMGPTYPRDSFVSVLIQLAASFEISRCSGIIKAKLVLITTRKCERGRTR